MFVQLPTPDLFVNWQEWASALHARLARAFASQRTELQAFTVATLPDATQQKYCLIIVSNETGGTVPAFSDGTNWRRVTDRAIVS